MILLVLIALLEVVVGPLVIWAGISEKDSSFLMWGIVLTVLGGGFLILMAASA